MGQIINVAQKVSVFHRGSDSLECYRRLGIFNMDNSYAYYSRMIHIKNRTVS